MESGVDFLNGFWPMVPVWAYSQPEYQIEPRTHVSRRPFHWWKRIVHWNFYCSWFYGWQFGVSRRYDGKGERIVRNSRGSDFKVWYVDKVCAVTGLCGGMIRGVGGHLDARKAEAESQIVSRFTLSFSYIRLCLIIHFIPISQEMSQESLPPL